MPVIGRRSKAAGGMLVASAAFVQPTLGMAVGAACLVAALVAVARRHDTTATGERGIKV